jgi:esterase/lipase superfamily enzyme
MIEPVLTVEAGDKVEDLLEILDRQPWIPFVAVRLAQDQVERWYVFDVATLQWLLEDAEPGDDLRQALSLETAKASETCDAFVDVIPNDRLCLILEGDNPVAVHPPVMNWQDVVVRKSGVPDAEKGVAGAADTKPADTNTETETRVVPVLFATDRNLTGEQGPYRCFGAQRDELRYGLAEVRIPETHRRGQLETPKWWRLELNENQQRHVSLLDVKLLDWDQFVYQLDKQQEALDSSDVLLFVHGYNVTFDAAVRRAAQISWDLRFPGVCMAYSWPSAGTLLGYTRDETSVQWSEHNFRQFLLNLDADTSVHKVHIIAHSLGNRLITEVLSQLSADQREHIGQVVLAAPDVDAGVFCHIAKRVAALAAQVTLYASSKDLALRLSKFVHGFRRAGDSEPKPVVVEPVVSIDASSVSTDLLGHSYIGDAPSILADVYWLLKEGGGPEQRPFYLSLVEADGDRYWLFNP